MKWQQKKLLSVSRLFGLESQKSVSFFPSLATMLMAADYTELALVGWVQSRHLEVPSSFCEDRDNKLKIDKLINLIDKKNIPTPQWENYLLQKNGHNVNIPFNILRNLLHVQIEHNSCCIIGIMYLSISCTQKTRHTCGLTRKKKSDLSKYLSDYHL